MTTERFGIGEWFGHTIESVTADFRKGLAADALGANENGRPCPFRNGNPRCPKAGGVCSLRAYRAHEESVELTDRRAIVCPSRFEQDDILIRWLAEILDYGAEPKVAREAPFMRSTATGKWAGKVDMVVAHDGDGQLKWCGLEIQAVYFSGQGMRSEFTRLRENADDVPPFPDAVRRPDWRSSGAKRLMPQLQIKVPTLRRWGSKMAVAVDAPFFDAIGGPSEMPTQDLNDGDIIWLVPELQESAEGDLTLVRGHWEVLTLEESGQRLLAAVTVPREEFETGLQSRLRPM